MRKNKAMRLASVLLIAVLLTTCVISGTFAKYVSSANSSDKARVAKWGFDSTTKINIEDLFEKNNVDTLNDAAEADVSGSEDVIAPGTSNSATIQFVNAMGTGKAPEVAYSISVSTEGSSINANIAANPNILWALDTGDYGTWATLLEDIEKLSQDYVAPNTLPTNFGDGAEHTISWKWVFSDSDAHDIMDTNMGNIEANGTTQLVELVITITATQID